MEDIHLRPTSQSVTIHNVATKLQANIRTLMQDTALVDSINPINQTNSAEWLAFLLRIPEIAGTIHASETGHSD
jgi:hypothetical protein